jgi:hypothetical protein
LAAAATVAMRMEKMLKKSSSREKVHASTHVWQILNMNHIQRIGFCFVDFSNLNIKFKAIILNGR